MNIVYLYYAVIPRGVSIYWVLQTFNNNNNNNKPSPKLKKKYQCIVQAHLFTPIAIETAGVWNSQAREFITELGKGITTVTGEIKETSYIFQQVSVAIQRGNMMSFIGSFTTDTD